MKRFFKIILYVYLFSLLYVCLLRGMVIEPKLMFDNVRIEIIPFSFIQTILYVSNCVIQSGHSLKENIPAILWDNIHGPLLNTLIFIPFGILIPIVYKKYDTPRKIAILSIVVSFVKEILKVCISFLGMAFGRMFMIDNIIAACAGALLGYLLLHVLRKSSLNRMIKM